jgi:hypothetical protein
MQLAGAARFLDREAGWTAGGLRTREAEKHVDRAVWLSALNTA